MMNSRPHRSGTVAPRTTRDGARLERDPDGGAEPEKVPPQRDGPVRYFGLRNRQRVHVVGEEIGEHPAPADPEVTEVRRHRGAVHHDPEVDDDDGQDDHRGRRVLTDELDGRQLGGAGEQHHRHRDRLQRGYPHADCDDAEDQRKREYPG